MIDEAAAGRVFMHYPGVLIAFQATRPFTSGTARPPFTTPAARRGRATRSSACPAPRSPPRWKPRRPPIIPATTPEARLHAFRETIIARTRVALVPGDPVAGSYTDRRGTRDPPHLRRRRPGGRQAGGPRRLAHGVQPLGAAGLAWHAPLVVSDGQDHPHLRPAKLDGHGEPVCPSLPTEMGPHPSENSRLFPLATHSLPLPQNEIVFSRSPSSCCSAAFPRGRA